MNIFDYLIQMLKPLASEEYISILPEEEDNVDASPAEESEDDEDTGNENDDLYATHYKDND
jgi:hypothetical protein